MQQQFCTFLCFSVIFFYVHHHRQVQTCIHLKLLPGELVGSTGALSRLEFVGQPRSHQNCNALLDSCTQMQIGENLLICIFLSLNMMQQTNPGFDCRVLLAPCPEECGGAFVGVGWGGKKQAVSIAPLSLSNGKLRSLFQLRGQKSVRAHHQSLRAYKLAPIN